MANKTALIEQLTRAPVKFQSRRLEHLAMPPAIVEDSSDFESTSAHAFGREIYRFEARFGATFWRLLAEPEAYRLERYRTLLQTVAEGVYGEVRNEVRALLPLLWKIDDRELRDTVEGFVLRVLDMTEVD